MGWTLYGQTSETWRLYPNKGSSVRVDARVAAGLDRTVDCCHLPVDELDDKIVHVVAIVHKNRMLLSLQNKKNC